MSVKTKTPVLFDIDKEARKYYPGHDRDAVRRSSVTIYVSKKIKSTIKRGSPFEYSFRPM